MKKRASNHSNVDWQWSRQSRKYLWNGFVRIPFLVNVVINASLPWVLFRQRDRLPVWGGPESLHGEMIITAILLPLLTAWICGRTLRRQTLGEAHAIPLPTFRVADEPIATTMSSLRVGFWQAMERVTGEGSWVGGVLFTLVCGPLIYATGWLVVVVYPGPAISIGQLSLVKAVFAGFHGCWVTPLYAMSVLVNTANRRRDD
ncbi:hypothetical protein LF1_36310 [Rubripirellula obstinata]|uniref:Uncharacterized protein n=1 Tax=Rubripirellula obstinata TaxID=406547 RepID=A0A5B1CIU9_9BACT|nr:hypothetical protein [Rubripirellula obstinata]KAA1261087.1 hypothetical protein LF1_36310 [Rubripirellula obstinata]